MNYAISRLQNYKFNECGAILKEALRTLPNYDNPDCNPDLSYLNVALVTTDFNGLTFEKYIAKYRKDNNIKGRFNINANNPKNMTNVCSQALFTASKEYIENMSRYEQIEYFNHCLDFFKNEFSTAKIISAVIHFDETTPHMHVTFLPIANRFNERKQEQEYIFSTTLLMPGKDFFRGYQDRFFDYISSCGYSGLTRSNSNRKNMSVKEYKKYQQLMVAIEALKEERKELYDEIEKLLRENKDLRYYRDLFKHIPILGLIVEIVLDCCVDNKNASISRAINELQTYRVVEQVKRSSLDDKIANAESKKPTDYDAFTPSKKRLVDKIFRDN